MQTMRRAMGATEFAPVDARAALRGWLESTACPEAVATDALIVITELVTNVVVHAKTPSVMIVSFDDHRLRLEVDDGDSTPPVLGEPSEHGGFGLVLVEALCDTWGWDPTEFGKRVWTEQLC